MFFFFFSVSVVLFWYLINGLCNLMMTVMKIYENSEMCGRRNPITKGVSITCCIRQCAQILPDTQSQLHFLCVSPFAVQKGEKRGILRSRQEKDVRQLHLTGVQVSALSQPGPHRYWPSCCIEIVWPQLLHSKHCHFTVVVVPITGEKRIDTLLNFKSSHF